MEENNKGWKKLREVKLDKKQLSRHARRIEKTTTKHASRYFFQRLGNIKYVRRQLAAWLIIVALAVSGLGLQLLFSQKSYTMTAGARGGTYIEGALGPINTLNPLYAATSAESSISKLLFSSLYSYDETGSLRGDLAKSMTIGGDNRVYTVEITDKAKWHDGEQLDAGDVVFTINLIKNPATRLSLRVNWMDVEVKQVGDYKIEFTLPAAYAAFPHALTFPILPEHSLKNVTGGALRESTFSRAPIGSGPFKYRLFQSSDSLSNHIMVSMTANSDYYKGTPKLDRFEVHGYETEPDVVKALRSGEINGAVDVSPTSLDQINKNSYKVTYVPSTNGVYLLLNHNSTLIKSGTIRKALQLATDTDAIIKNISPEYKKLDLPVINSQLRGDIPKADILDIGKANKLLDDDGWVVGSDGIRTKGETKLELSITTTNTAEYERVVDILTEQWKKIGVSVKKTIINVDGSLSNFIQNTLQPRNYDILLYELSIGSDPDVYAYWHSSQIKIDGFNFANYSSGDSDINLSTARNTVDSEIRNAKYIQFSRQWLADVASIGLYQSGVNYVSSQNAYNVEGESILPRSVDRYSNILDWTVKKDLVYDTP